MLTLLLGLCMVWILGPWIILAAYHVVWPFDEYRWPPFASAYYTVYVTNETEREIVVSVQCLNDAGLRIAEMRPRHFWERLGWADMKEVLLQPGMSEYVVLGADSDPRLAVLLAVARTAKASHPMRQSLALYRLDWPWSEGRWAWREQGSVTGWPIMELTVQPEDLVEFNSENLVGRSDDGLADVDLPLIHR